MTEEANSQLGTNIRMEGKNGGRILGLELELIQSHMTRKPMLRGEVYAQIGCAQAEQT